MFVSHCRAMATARSANAHVGVKLQHYHNTMSLISHDLTSEMLSLSYCPHCMFNFNFVIFGVMNPTTFFYCPS